MRQRIFFTLTACIAMTLLATAPYSGSSAAQGTPGATSCQGNATPAAPATAAATGTADTMVNTTNSHSVSLENGDALLWPGGDHGVLLLHGAVYDAASWDAQARVLSSHGYTVLALEELSSAAVFEGIDFLIHGCATKGVVVIGASAGGGAALSALASDPDGIAGLILLSATGKVNTLGDYPKLFTASNDEGLGDQLEKMAQTAPGNRNELVILPGSAHAQAIFKSDQGDTLLAAILVFLDESVTWGPNRAI